MLFNITTTILVTTNNPTTAQMGSTHYQVATQNQTLPVTSVSGQQSTTGASTSTSKPTTLGLSNTTSTTTQIPVQTATCMFSFYI